MDLQSPTNLPTQPTPATPPVPLVAPVVPPSIQAMPTAASSAPDDMFSGVDKAQVPAVAPAPAPTPASTPPAPLAPQRVLSSLPEPHRPPVLHYVLIALGVIVVLGVIAGTVWFFAIRRPANQVMKALPIVSVASSTDELNAVPAAAPSDEPVGGTTEFGEPEEIPSKPVVTSPDGTSIPAPSSIDPDGSGVLGAPVSASVSSTTSLAPLADSAAPTTDVTAPTPTPVQPADQDADGLSDAREIELGTNPSLADTDGDALTDGDEVLKYRTNPLVPDTDGDSYPDGVEVQKGFNPLGPGKCANQTCTF